MRAAPLSGLVIAFDYGERRIGLAVGNRLTGTAAPAGIVDCRDGVPQWEVIDRCIQEWQPDTLIIGRPPSGHERLQQRIANFVQDLENRYKLPVRLVDENLSSAAAQATLADKRRTGERLRRVRRGDVDMLAACIIAQRWLAQTDTDTDA